ncbi:type I restriction endonuclease subunit R [Paraneptunicella aestuarii]|uniref:type I restriction endonuclease subunit R n=1 Tax=Paraneptunicella aestuarii TaxID=2831148 RepID=UPI001E38FB38|nr:HsdR family type I site-specific deoxyribonuclease [Paraneptunicella aestuarii]UAA38580.1 type I restriction endonuclease subunit R [Paraneptunicella aestuarii]
MTVPNTNEQYASHIPAVATLISLGWQFISQSDCMALRGSSREVLLKPQLIAYLSKKTFDYKGQTYPLSAQAIDQILRKLSSPGLNEGLMAANQTLYNDLTLGITVTEFMPDGKKYQPNVALIDWQHIDNNLFYVSEEFEVLNGSGTQSRRPDVVCFVNGIPLVVIEAKRPDSGNAGKSMVDEGISQTIRNQKQDEIPELFVYAQLMLAISMTEGRYGTTETEAKFWAKWDEEELAPSVFHDIKNTPIPAQQKQALFADKSEKIARYFEELWSKEQLPSNQDKLIISLLSKQRLLEFVRYFILFDKKVGKIAARYQQVFGIKALIKQISGFKPDGSREGGVIWHTTGSGKSFTMVLLCKALLLANELQDCRIIVVTDRVDLETQLAKTFLTGGAFGSDISSKKKGDELAKVKTGKQLAQRIGEGNERIIFTIINKFTSATKLPECHNPSNKLIVLIDEGHRSQGGETHERMRQALPNASYIAFTGTPLLKNDKTTNKFGPIVHAYTMKRAVEDGTVTPLLYEERKPELNVNAASIDAWFDKITQGLSEAQKTDLKKKFSTKGVIYGAERRLELIAWDIATHFNDNFKALDMGLKGQLACDSKLSAIRYKKFLDDIGLVSSAIVISPPDTREGHEKVDESALPEIQQWWKDNVKSDADTYEKKVIEDFATEGAPDILIVVDKLLTGFDEPRNSVLYIDKPLKQHNLIQAIARVNRLHEQKQYGLLIDYRGILKELDTAIAKYQDLEKRTQGGFDLNDIDAMYADVNTEYRRLPQLHAALWAIFASVVNRQDIEQYRQVLLPKYQKDNEGVEYDARLKLREDFYDALTQFGLCLKVALSTRSFFEDSAFSEDRITEYKRDLKWFLDLRKIVRQDALETIDYSTYEKQIRKLVNKDVTANAIAEPDGVYVVSELGREEPESWNEEKTRNETDIIRTRLKKSIEQELAADPYAQQYFSELLKQAILEAEALFDHPYKQYAIFKTAEEQMKARDIPDMPPAFANNKQAQAYYGAFRLALGEELTHFDDETQASLITEAFEVENIVRDAVAENSLNPLGIESAIQRALLPRLFALVGLDRAQDIIEQVINIMRAGFNRK